MKRLILVGSIALAVVAAISLFAFIPRAVGEAEWRELGSIEDLRRSFNDDEGSIRVVLLLSPT